MTLSKTLRLQGKNHQLMLFILIGIVAITYIKILLDYDQTAHLGMSLLFALACGTLLWERRAAILLKRSPLEFSLGIVGVICTLAIGYFLLNQDLSQTGQALNLQKQPGLNGLIRMFPALGGFSIVLLASGWSGLKQFWRELAILLALGLPGTLAAFVADISPLTARFSTALLWYTGFEVLREGLRIYLEGGGVEVYYGCSGIESVSYVLGLSILCLIMFPLLGFKRYLVPLTGMVIGFVINGVRVALMAVLVASGDEAAFDYWHTGDGSLIFGPLAVVIFGAFYMSVQTFEQNWTALDQTMHTYPDKPEITQDLLAFLEADDNH